MRHYDLCCKSHPDLLFSTQFKYFVCSKILLPKKPLPSRCYSAFQYVITQYHYLAPSFRWCNQFLLPKQLFRRWISRFHPDLRIIKWISGQRSLPPRFYNMFRYFLWSVLSQRHLRLVDTVGTDHFIGRLTFNEKKFSVSCLIKTQWFHWLGDDPFLRFKLLNKCRNHTLLYDLYTNFYCIYKLAWPTINFLCISLSPTDLRRRRFQLFFVIMF